MSQEGTRAFYQATETIKSQLLEDVNVNTVTTGDISDVDLQKQTIFPLSHIIINNVGQEDGVLRFNQLDGNPNIEPFYDRFDNEVAGWTITMDILIYNDISIC